MAFEHTSKDLEVRPKNVVPRRIINVFSVFRIVVRYGNSCQINHFRQFFKAVVYCYLVVKVDLGPWVIIVAYSMYY